ncbi:PilZ domain-containing protein [Marinobacter sp. SS21]|uniref:PilZ domain-containing protein n=1 Tax=Marinobacter sp. SS21 TaxID=2979460 RepID=UPI00232D5294|nr:PilZ domain-containing protein [Marinobacter sp. SS21]MDC0663268.1 PilZ domain-containing protein [Marinobacter sp. SS21]
MTSDRREHLRTSMTTKVSVEHPIKGRVVVPTRDISDGGVFILAAEGELELELGDAVSVQVQGLPVPAPVLEMVVVRKVPDGYGLQFSGDDQ